MKTINVTFHLPNEFADHFERQVESHGSPDAYLLHLIETDVQDSVTYLFRMSLPGAIRRSLEALEFAHDDLVSEISQLRHPELFDTSIPTEQWLDHLKALSEEIAINEATLVREERREEKRSAAKSTAPKEKKKAAAKKPAKKSSSAKKS